MKKGCLWAIGIFVILIIIGRCVGDDNTANTDNVNTDNANTEKVTQKNTEESSGKKTWTHKEEKDEMRGNIDKFDFIISDNTVDFEFPYNGGSYLRMVIRHSVNKGTDVYLQIIKGQFGGNDFSGSNYVAIKFDNEEIKNYYFNIAEDAKTETIFLKKTQEIISKCKTAKNIKIEAPFFQEGRRVFNFHVDVPYKEQ